MSSQSRRPLDAVDGIEWLWQHAPPRLIEGWPVWHPKDAEQALRGLGRSAFELAYRTYENRMHVAMAWYSHLAETTLQQGLQPGMVAVRCTKCGEVVRVDILEFCRIVPVEHPTMAPSPFRYLCPRCQTEGK